MYIYQISKFQDSGPLRFLITYCHFIQLFLFDPRKMDAWNTDICKVVETGDYMYEDCMQSSLSTYRNNNPIICL